MTETKKPSNSTLKKAAVWGGAIGTLLVSAFIFVVGLFLLSIGVWGIVVWPLVVILILNRVINGITVVKKVRDKLDGKEEDGKIVVNVNAAGANEEAVKASIKRALAERQY
jgi:hypothetical protein